METHREAETQAEGEAGSLQEARCGTRSQDPGSRPEPEVDAPPLSHWVPGMNTDPVPASEWPRALQGLSGNQSDLWR